MHGSAILTYILKHGIIAVCYDDEASALRFISRNRVPADGVCITESICFSSYTLSYWRFSQRCMSQQLGNEVERQGKANKSYGIRTHDTLQSRRALYQLSYQGNSAGRGTHV